MTGLLEQEHTVIQWALIAIYFHSTVKFYTTSKHSFYALTPQLNKFNCIDFHVKNVPFVFIIFASYIVPICVQYILKFI